MKKRRNERGSSPHTIFHVVRSSRRTPRTTTRTHGVARAVLDARSEHGHSYGRSTPRAHAGRAYGVAVGDIRPSLRCGFLSPTGTGPAPGLAQTRTRQVDSRCAPERDPTQTRAVATRRRTHAARSDSLCTLDRAVDTDRGRAYQYSRPIDSDGGLQPAFAL